MQSENHLSLVVDDEKIKMKLRRDAARHSSNISAGVELDLKRGISEQDRLHVRPRDQAVI